MKWSNKVLRAATKTLRMLGKQKRGLVATGLPFKVKVALIKDEMRQSLDALRELRDAMERETGEQLRKEDPTP